MLVEKKNNNTFGHKVSITRAETTKGISELVAIVHPRSQLRKNHTFGHKVSFTRPEKEKRISKSAAIVHPRS
jgi:hypothetical protein